MSQNTKQLTERVGQIEKFPCLPLLSTPTNSQVPLSLSWNCDRVFMAFYIQLPLLNFLKLKRSLLKNKILGNTSIQHK